MPMSLKQS